MWLIWTKPGQSLSTPSRASFAPRWISSTRLKRSHPSGVSSPGAWAPWASTAHPFPVISGTGLFRAKMFAPKTWRRGRNCCLANQNEVFKTLTSEIWNQLKSSKHLSPFNVKCLNYLNDLFHLHNCECFYLFPENNFGTKSNFGAVLSYTTLKMSSSVAMTLCSINFCLRPSAKGLGKNRVVVVIVLFHLSNFLLKINLSEGPEQADPSLQGCPRCSTRTPSTGHATTPSGCPSGKFVQETSSTAHNQKWNWAR